MQKKKSFVIWFKWKLRNLLLNLNFLTFLEKLNFTKSDRNSSKLTGRHGSLQDDLAAHFGFERASNTRHNTVFVIRQRTFSFFLLGRKSFLDSNFIFYNFFITLLFHEKNHVCELLSFINIRFRQRVLKLKLARGAEKLSRINSSRCLCYLVVMKSWVIVSWEILLCWQTFKVLSDQLPVFRLIFGIKSNILTV